MQPNLTPGPALSGGGGGGESRDRRPPRRVVIGGIVLAVLASVVIPAVIVGLVLFFSADMRERTHAFLDASRESRFDDAYALTTRSFQARVPREALPGYLEQRVPSVLVSTGAWINGFSGGIGEQCMEVWVYTPRGDTTVYIILHDEDGAWKIDDLTLEEIGLCDSD